MKSWWAMCVGGMLLTGCGEELTEEGSVTQAAVTETEGTGGFSEDAVFFEFGSNEDSSWFAVNDTVMGGVSDGEVFYTESEMVFEGVVSTDSNGGFTSVRSPDQQLDLRPNKRVLIRMRSEGQPFTMVLANNPYWYQDQFRYDIELESDEWTEVEIALNDFELHSLATGYPTPTGDMMRRGDRAEILHVEFISKLFEEGPFRLEVDYVIFD